MAVQGFSKQSIPGIRDLLLQFRRFLSSMPNWHAGVTGDVDYYQGEVQDRLHDIEFSKLERNSGYKKVRELQKTQHARREAKELREFSEVLNKFALDNKKLVGELTKTLNALDKVTNDQQNRIYAPRSDMKIDVAYVHYDKETGSYS